MSRVRFQAESTGSANLLIAYTMQAAIDDRVCGTEKVSVSGVLRMSSRRRQAAASYLVE